jgi:cell division septation protein DedD
VAPGPPEGDVSAAAVQAASAGPAQAEAPAVAVVQAKLAPGQPGPDDLFGELASAPDHGRPFTLRLGCYKTAESAEAAASIYARRSLAPFVAYVNLQQQGRWWIFYTGSFASREEAERTRAGIHVPEADIISMPYACRVGVFASADMDASLVSAMQELGCIPYVLDNGDGTFSLFAGVYRQRDNAEILRKALADNNIVSTVALLRPGTAAPPAAGPGDAPQVPAS